MQMQNTKMFSYGKKLIKYKGKNIYRRVKKYFNNTLN